MPHLYRDTVAHADRRTEQVVEAGDHVIVIASVTDGQPPSSEARRLMYFRHHYRAWPRVVDTPATVSTMCRDVELKLKSKLERPCREARAQRPRVA